MRDPLFRMALVLGLLAAVGPFAVDMYLPALPQVARDLNTSGTAAAMTLTAYFITFGIAQMVYGPMADALGRKLPIVIGTAIFLAATLAAILAPSIGWLIAARALQGLGSATLMVVPDVPVAGMALILGIDRFMSECRALTNFIGNAVATVVVSWWEGRLDRDRFNAAMAGQPLPSDAVAAE